MFKKIINFIKFHNAFAICVSSVLLLTFSAMASENVRNAVIGEVIVTEQGIDNSQLLAANLENFDINLKIENILEDEENYYVDYTFNTIAVRDNIWQPVGKVEKFTVNKTALGNRDLGIYLAEELSEVIRGEMAYLKEAQKNERERGRTQIVKTTDYTGLIGLVLDLKNKILPGYEPVVKPPVAEIIQELIVQKPVCQPITEVCDGSDNNCDGSIDEGGVCEETPVTLSSIAITTPATKLVYTVGELLDITGLAIIGTYSDGSTKSETITVANVTGFDNSTSTTAQILTIAVDGKTATYTVTVNAVVAAPDTTAPVITLVGEAVVTVKVGDTYADAGATATDAVDGDITANIVVNNPVDTNAAGTYVITYNVADATGNQAQEVTRTVNVNVD